MRIASSQKLSNLQLQQYRRYSIYSFVIFLLIILLSFCIVLTSDYRTFETKFGTDAEKIHTQIIHNLTQDELVLEGFSSFIAGLGRHYNAETLNRYARKIQTRFPHIHMLEIAEAVKENDLRAFMQKQRNKGAKDFTVKAFDYSGNRSWKTLAKAEVHFPLIYLYPMPAESRKILGLDMSSHPHLNHSLQRAIKSHGFETSSPFNLIEGDRAYVIFKSVDVGEDKSKLRFMTLLVITAEKLLTSAMLDDSSVGILVFHNSKEKEDESGHLISRKIKYSKILPVLTFESALSSTKQGYILQITKPFTVHDIRWHILFFILIFLSLLFYQTRKIVTQNTLMQKNEFNELQYKSKASAISNLTGGIAHEFNNSLCVVRGFLSLLAEKNSKDNESLLWIRHADDASEKCIALTKKLLTYSRYKGVKERVGGTHLNEFINSIKAELSAIVKETVTLNYDLAENLPAIYLSEIDLKGILSELVKNSNDSIQETGEISITTDLINLTDSQPLEIGAVVEAGEYLHIAVSDTGCGIDEQIKMHVFDPFFTTKSVGEGSGMGLATVYGLVKLNDGYINASAGRHGGGTTINIYIPVKKSQA